MDKFKPKFLAIEIILYTFIRNIAEESAVIQDYLNLCAEEYYWFKKGRIPKEVWFSWKQGIAFYLQCSQIRHCFLKEVSFRKSYYGLFDGIEELLAEKIL